MPLSALDTMERMRGTTFCVAPTGDSDGFTQRFYYILAAGCIPVRVRVRVRVRVEADPTPDPALTLAPPPEH